MGSVSLQISKKFKKNVQNLGFRLHVEMLFKHISLKKNGYIPFLIQLTIQMESFSLQISKKKNEKRQSPSPPLCPECRNEITDRNAFLAYFITNYGYDVPILKEVGYAEVISVSTNQEEKIKKTTSTFFSSLSRIWQCGYRSKCFFSIFHHKLRLRVSHTKRIR